MMERKAARGARDHPLLMQTNCDFRILLVEDDPGCREALCTILEDAGFLVAETDGLEAARAPLREVRFDAIVSDYRLGDGCASDVLAEARTRRNTCEGVIITGSDDCPVTAGSVEVLRKPFDLGQFLDAVGRTAIAGRRAWLMRRRTGAGAQGQNRLLQTVWSARSDRLEVRLARHQVGKEERPLHKRQDAVDERMRALDDSGT